MLDINSIIGSHTIKKSLGSVTPLPNEIAIKRAEVVKRRPPPPDDTSWAWDKNEQKWIRPTGAVFMPVPVGEKPPSGILPPEMEWYRKEDGTWETRDKIEMPIPVIIDSMSDPVQDKRRHKWLATLAPWETARIPAKGTPWYNYIMDGTPLPTGLVTMPVPEPTPTPSPEPKIITIKDWKNPGPKTPPDYPTEEPPTGMWYQLMSSDYASIDNKGNAIIGRTFGPGPQILSWKWMAVPNNIKVLGGDIHVYPIPTSLEPVPTPEPIFIPIVEPLNPPVHVMRPKQPTVKPKEGYVWAKTGFFVLGVDPKTGRAYMGGRLAIGEIPPEYKWLQVPKKYATVTSDGRWEYNNTKWTEEHLPIIVPVPIPEPRLVGGGGWAKLKNPASGVEGWIQYGIGTQYRYGGKEFDQRYKGWKVVEEGRDLKPPKGADLLPSGYPPIPVPTPVMPVYPGGMKHVIASQEPRFVEWYESKYPPSSTGPNIMPGYVSQKEWEEFEAWKIDKVNEPGGPGGEVLDPSIKPSDEGLEPNQEWAFHEGEWKVIERHVMGPSLTPKLKSTPKTFTVKTDVVEERLKDLLDKKKTPDSGIKSKLETARTTKQDWLLEHAENFKVTGSPTQAPKPKLRTWGIAKKLYEKIR